MDEGLSPGLVLAAEPADPADESGEVADNEDRASAMPKRADPAGVGPAPGVEASKIPVAARESSSTDIWSKVYPFSDESKLRPGRNVERQDQALGQIAFVNAALGEGMTENLAAVRARRCWVVDLDGVVYAGEHALPGAVAAVQALRDSGREVAFLTNNSRHRRAEVRRKLLELGIPCAEKEVLNTSCATAHYLLHRGLTREVGVLGMPGLAAELAEHGVTLAEVDVCATLVVGIDLDFTYEKLVRGLRALRRGIPFIACNRDANYPGRDSQLLAGCGAMVAALEAAAQRSPSYEVGKPNPFMLELLCRGLQRAKADCVMIGDSLEADILMAERAGVPSIFIGEPPPPPAAEAALRTLPTLHAADLADAVRLVLGPGMCPMY